MKTRIACFLALAALLTFAGAALAEDIEIKRDLTYGHQDGYVDILRDGKSVMRYVYKDTPAPYVCPVQAPCGESVTRAYPVKQAAGASADHPHHKSMWLAFGDVNGVDFWAEGEKCGKIVQKSISFDGITPGHWGIHTKNDWVAPDGTRLLEEDRHYSFLSCKYGTLVSTMITLIAPDRDVDLNDTKEGFFAVRVAPSISLTEGKGQILNSEGKKGADCLGQRARWCDYTGQVNGKTVGVTMFDVPSNYGYPTYWHARDYGLLAANPMGGKAFTNDPKSESGYQITQGGGVRFVYITLIHDETLTAEVLNSIADQTAGMGNGETRNAPPRPKRKPFQVPTMPEQQPAEQPKAQEPSK